MRPRDNWTTCGKRKRGKIYRVLQREPKRAPHASRYPPKNSPPNAVYRVL